MLWCPASGFSLPAGELLCCLRPLVVLAVLVLLRLGVVFFPREGEGGDDSRTDHVLQVLPYASRYSGMTLGGRIRTIWLEWDIAPYDRFACT